VVLFHDVGFVGFKAPTICVFRDDGEERRKKTQEREKRIFEQQESRPVSPELVAHNLSSQKRNL
jgi:hypothetical protein